MTSNLTSHIETEKKMACGLPWLQPSLAGWSFPAPSSDQSIDTASDKMYYSCNPRAIRKLEAVITNVEIGLVLILRTACSPGNVLTGEGRLNQDEKGSCIIIRQERYIIFPGDGGARL